MKSYCAKCNAVTGTAGRDKYCYQCGAELIEQPECKCGRRLFTIDKYCPSCGKKVETKNGS